MTADKRRPDVARKYDEKGNTVESDLRYFNGGVLTNCKISSSGNFINVSLTRISAYSCNKCRKRGCYKRWLYCTNVLRYFYDEFIRCLNFHAICRN